MHVMEALLILAPGRCARGNCFVLLCDHVLRRMVQFVVRRTDVSIYMYLFRDTNYVHVNAIFQVSIHFKPPSPTTSVEIILAR